MIKFQIDEVDLGDDKGPMILFLINKFLNSYGDKIEGKFVKDICFNLENRIPILSVGSNRSPYQLKRKFSLNEDICVTPAKLFDSDIVYAASISAW